MYVQFEQMYAWLASVLTNLRLYVNEMNEENFEDNPVNVGFLYTEMPNLLPKFSKSTGNFPLGCCEWR